MDRDDKGARVPAPGGRDEQQLYEELQTQNEELRQQQEELAAQNVELSKLRDNLAASQARYQALFDLAPVGFLLLDDRRRVQEVNSTFQRMVTPRSVAKGQRWELCFHHDDRDALHRLLQGLEEGGPPKSWDVRLDPLAPAEDGPAQGVQWVRLEALSLQAEQTGAAYQVAAIDISAQRQSELERAKATELLQSTIDGVDDPILVVDLDYRVRLKNRALADYIAAEQLVDGQPCHQLMHGSEQPCTALGIACPLKEVVEQGRPTRVVHTHRLRDGSDRELEIMASPLYGPSGDVSAVVQSMRDITGRLRMERELEKARRIEALGQLAGGIAHDFNNLLAASSGQVELAMAVDGVPEVVVGRLREARDAMERASGLTRQLLTFSTGGAPVKEATSIPQLLERSARFVTSGTSTNCMFRNNEELWTADVDPGQLSQVIENLVLNAAQAMPDGGCVQLTSANAVVSEGELGDLSAGRYVRIDVSDDGPGVAQDVREQIFDPYFTTKESGSGLGLATAYSILQRHHGALELLDTNNLGATFRIHVPAAELRTTAKQAKDYCCGRGEAAGDSHGKVLVLDDEPMVLSVFDGMLGKAGFDVTTCCDGESAVRRFQEAQDRGDPFDVVILDLTIPGGMGGRAVIRELLALEPAVRAIVTSGYNDSPVMANYRDYGFCGAIAKPFRRSALLEVVEEAMAGAPP